MQFIVGSVKVRYNQGPRSVCSLDTQKEFGDIDCGVYSLRKSSMVGMWCLIKVKHIRVLCPVIMNSQ